MNFRDEYKKEISELSPDEAALERIRSGVAKRLAEPEVTKKKPLPLRRIAVIGGSVAACLVIGVTAVVITGGGRNLADKMNNMTAINAPTASASGGSMAGGANAAPNPGMNFNGVNGDGSADPGGMQNDEGIFGEASANDGIGDFSPDTSMPAGTAAEQEPSSSKTAMITLDGEMLTLEYNGETTVFRARTYDGVSKDSEDGLSAIPALPDENAERIEVMSSDGEKMILVLQDDKAVLFDSENGVLGIYVKTE